MGFVTGHKVSSYDQSETQVTLLGSTELSLNQARDRSQSTNHGVCDWSQGVKSQVVIDHKEGSQASCL